MREKSRSVGFATVAVTGAGSGIVLAKLVEIKVPADSEMSAGVVLVDDEETATISSMNGKSSRSTMAASWEGQGISVLRIGEETILSVSACEHSIRRGALNSTGIVP